MIGFLTGTTSLLNAIEKEKNDKKILEEQKRIFRREKEELKRQHEKNLSRAKVSFLAKNRSLSNVKNIFDDIEEELKIEINKLKSKENIHELNSGLKKTINRNNIIRQGTNLIKIL